MIDDRDPLITGTLGYMIRGLVNRFCKNVKTLIL